MKLKRHKASIWNRYIVGKDDEISDRSKPISEEQCLKNTPMCMYTPPIIIRDLDPYWKGEKKSEMHELSAFTKYPTKNPTVRQKRRVYVSWVPPPGQLNRFQIEIEKNHFTLEIAFM